MSSPLNTSPEKYIFGTSSPKTSIGSKSLKLSDLEKRGIADVNSITIIANDGIGFMKGY